ncbi:MAG TPA: UDP-N-acetylglucosamine 2-epimerase [Paucimonas sp.]|nr:UDP-N-acetylglucosamine 2-epimerase [Paucimonas sp.]
MIICFIGTRAQLIKMAPIILRLEERRAPLHLVFTGQHQETMAQLMADFGIRTVPLQLYDEQEITGLVQMAGWFVRCLWRCLREAERFLPRSPRGNDAILVHGDTMSTLLGALAGKLRRMKVAHIEAGLRSRNIFHPFPEELTRLAVSRLSDLAFCPGRWACDNLESSSALRIDTHQNTLIEALALALNASPGEPAPALLPEGAFGIASIHRFENIFNKRRLTQIIDLIEVAANRYPIVFVLHPATRKKVAKFGLLARLEMHPRIRLVPRMGYIDFVKLMRQSTFVITDGGGNQEELSYLGVPTLLMRKATERQEGIGTTATLCNFDHTALHEFLAGLESGRKPGAAPEVSPTAIIIDGLAGYAS